MGLGGMVVRVTDSLLPCSSVTNLTQANGNAAGKVTSGLAETNGSLTLGLRLSATDCN